MAALALLGLALANHSRSGSSLRSPAARCASAGSAGLLATSVLAAAVALATGCVQDDGTRFNPIQKLTPSIDEHAERELGWEFDRALRQAAPLIHDPVVIGFVSDLGQSIVQLIEPQPFVYRFRVVRDPQLNAFAVPGGFVYFHSGTVLAASSVDELAGVMGHEIAHVKASHYARMREQSAIPDLATTLIGLTAAIAAKDPAPLVVAQGINVSMQLRYSREAESEADQLGAIWMSRAGFLPTGIVRFFERILALRDREPNRIPPYLYSHPAVEERIKAVKIQGENLRPMRPRDPDWNERLSQVQVRLAMLVESGRDTLSVPTAPVDPTKTEPLLAAAEERAARNERDAALLVLARAEATEPNDPRVPYRIGELLQEAGRPAEAAAAFRRALHLDPSRALVFFKLGRAYAAQGERHRAVFALEQAELRAGAGSSLRERAAWEIEKLTFPVVTEIGFAAAPRAASNMPPPASDTLQSGARRVFWWARLGPHFVPYADRFRVRWIDPAGAVIHETRVAGYGRLYVGSTLERSVALSPGRWNVELRFDDDLIRSDPVEVGGGEKDAAAPAPPTLRRDRG